MTRPVVGNQKLYSHPIVFIPNRKKRIDFSFMSIAFLSENMLSVCFGKNDIYGVLAREVTSYKSLTTVFDDALALQLTVRNWG